LESLDIEARPVWKPLHLQPLYRGAESVGGEVAERIFEHGLCLPSGSALSPADQERIIAVVLERTGRGR
jgi:dTDP-4-amino-4,6-dideoxygalactose transaminase